MSDIFYSFPGGGYVRIRRGMFSNRGGRVRWDRSRIGAACLVGMPISSWTWRFGSHMDHMEFSRWLVEFFSWYSLSDW